MSRSTAAQIREARGRLFEAGPRWVRSDGDFELVALPEHECEVLRDALVREQPIRVVEIGLAYGASALAIAEALLLAGGDDPEHLIIDAFQDHFNEVGWTVLQEAGLGSTCTLLRERSQTALPRLLGEGVGADVAFVDGSHIFHNVFVDLYFLSEIVRPGGLIVLDDCEWTPVRTAVRYFELNTGWQIEALPSQRLRAFRLPDPAVEANFESFRPFSPN